MSEKMTTWVLGEKALDAVTHSVAHVELYRDKDNMPNRWRTSCGLVLQAPWRSHEDLPPAALAKAGVAPITCIECLAKEN